MRVLYALPSAITNRVEDTLGHYYLLRRTPEAQESLKYVVWEVRWQERGQHRSP